MSELFFFGPINNFVPPSVQAPEIPATNTAPPAPANLITRIVADTYTPKLVLEDLKGILAMEGNVDGTRYYRTITIYDNIDKSLDLIAKAGKHWSSVAEHFPVLIETKIWIILMIFLSFAS